MVQKTSDSQFDYSNVQCSTRRRQYFERMRRILICYYTMNTFAKRGAQAYDEFARDQGYHEDTPLQINLDGWPMLSNFGSLKHSYPFAVGQYVNQTVLAIYATFEAFVTDLVVDVMEQRGSTDPTQEAYKIFANSSWDARIDRLSSKLKLDLGRHHLNEKYGKSKFKLFGEELLHPIDLLQATADLRHLLMHGAGLVDKKYIRKYPKSGLVEGQNIQFPPTYPFILYYFLVPMSDFFDEAFSNAFGWSRPSLNVDELNDAKLRSL